MVMWQIAKSGMELRLFLLGLASTLLLLRCEGKLQLAEDLKCSVCEQVADHIEKELFSVDDSVTVAMGGRTDGQGGYNYVKYARSESRIYEILEDTCKIFKGMNAIDTDPITFYRRFTTLEPDPMLNQPLPTQKEDGTWINIPDMEKMKRPKETPKGLIKRDTAEEEATAACIEIVELNEDGITEYLYGNFNKDLRLREKICMELTGYCERWRDYEAEREAKLAAEKKAAKKAAKAAKAAAKAAKKAAAAGAVGDAAAADTADKSPSPTSPSPSEKAKKKKKWGLGKGKPTLYRTPPSKNSMSPSQSPSPSPSPSKTKKPKKPKKDNRPTPTISNWN